MALNPATYSTRPISMVMLAAMAGVALWLFLPLVGGSGSGPTGGESSPNQLPGMIARTGDVQVESTGGVVSRIVVPVTLRGGQPVDLAGGQLRAETALAETALAAVPASYATEWQSGDGDTLLEPGETALLFVDLPPNSGVLDTNPLRLVLKTAGGPGLIMEDVLGR